MQTNDRNIIDIMKNIENLKTQLPDFQREWVWDEERIRLLIGSIIKNYPVGAVMFLGYDKDNIRFKYSPFYNLKNKNEIIPDDLVLDGQQRLTSIYASMYSGMPVETCIESNKKSNIKRYYYIDIQKALKSDFDVTDAILIVPEDKKVKSNFGKNIVLDLSNIDNEYKQKMFPVNLLLKMEEKTKWAFGYREFYHHDSEISKEFDDFDNKIAFKALTYKIPVIFLEKDTSKEAVCQVFENVNTGGVPLTVFELVTAIYAMDDFKLKEDWKKIYDNNFKNSILGFLEGKDFLQACTLYNSYNKRNPNNDEGVSCKKTDVLKLTIEEYRNSRDMVIKGFKECEGIIKEERIFSTDNLPYTTQLIPLAIICSVLLENNKIREANVKEKIKRWYWCGVFGELYGGANETRFANDVVDVCNWILKSGKNPKTYDDCYFAPTRLLSLQTRQSAAYKGIMALIFQNHCKDLISGSEMDYVLFNENKIDIHHIFPRDYCENRKLKKELWNSICNKTPLTASTNREIGGSAPSVYLGKIEKKGQVNSNTLDSYLETHLINPSYIRNDNFDDYILDRTKNILDLIEKATNKAIVGRDSEDIILKFGGKV